MLSVTPLRLSLRHSTRPFYRGRRRTENDREPAALARPHRVRAVHVQRPAGDRDRARALVDALIAAVSA